MSEKNAEAFAVRKESLFRLIDAAAMSPESQTFAVIGGRVPAELASELEKSIRDLENSGKKVGFLLSDVWNDAALAYRAGWKFTSQSTIKAPYLTSVLRENGDIFCRERSLIRAVITRSDNDAYEELRERYGNAPFLRFCAEAGIDRRHGEVLYPRSITVRDMCRLWVPLFEFLNYRIDAREYASYFSDTAMSAVHAALGGKFRVQTKAGWESGTGEDAPGGVPEPRFVDGDPENDEIATNDTGVVYTDNGACLIAVFSDVQCDPEALIPLIRALHRAYSGLIKE